MSVERFETWIHLRMPGQCWAYANNVVLKSLLPITAFVGANKLNVDKELHACHWS